MRPRSNLEKQLLIASRLADYQAAIANLKTVANRMNFTQLGDLEFIRAKQAADRAYDALWKAQQS